MSILVKGYDKRTGTKGNAHLGWFQAAWELKE